MNFYCTGAIIPCTNFCQVVHLLSYPGPTHGANATAILPGETGMQHGVPWLKELIEHGDCKLCCTASSVEGRGVQPYAGSGFVLRATPIMGSLALQIRQLSMLCCCGRFPAADEMESLPGQQS